MYWYDGQLHHRSTVTLDASDPGLLYGATAFTTLRVYDSLDGVRTAWEAHRRRLQETIAMFGWTSPNWERLREGAERLAPHFPVLRVALFPDGRELILGRALPPDLSQRQTAGIVAWMADAPQFRRSLPHCKTGNYLPAWLALQTARQHDADEAILTNEAGDWLETSTGNLWGWCEGQWWTPPEEVGLLPGIARSQILQNAIAQHRHVEQRPWSSDRPTQFEALAYTNSVFEVVPIRTVVRDGTVWRSFDPQHPSLAELRSHLNAQH